jgi:hypothetical protein
MAGANGVQTNSGFLKGVEDSLDPIMRPEKHVMHSIIFAASAVFTLVYAFTSMNGATVMLTNLKMLRLDNLYDKTAVSKEALYQKWKCDGSSSALVKFNSNKTYDPWGPDSMCRCIRGQECGSAGCLDVEATCYNQKVVPTYAHVFAGYDIGHMNITIAFFLIHIAVLLNMTVETRDCYPKHFATKGRKKGEGAGEQQAQGQTQPGTPALPAPENVPPNQTSPPANNIPQEWDGYSGMRPSWKHRQDDLEVRMQLLGHKNTLGIRYEEEILDAKNEEKIGILQHESPRVFLLLALSVAVLICSIFSLATKESMRVAEKQMCDTENPCLTHTMIICVTMVLSVLNVCFFIYYCFVSFFGFKMLFSMFWLSIWEDVNHTVAFMLLTAGFGALSGVHDDATLLFDMLVVGVIGFLQSVQHNVMRQREHVISFCNRQDNKTATESQVKACNGRAVTVEKDVVGYFLYTRLFIFLFMIGSGFVFFGRIEATTFAQDTNATWFYYMRNVAVLVSILPNLLSDISYEIWHSVNYKATGDHTVYVGPHFWRRTIFLVYMIGFILLNWKNYVYEITASR